MKTEPNGQQPQGLCLEGTVRVVMVEVNIAVGGAVVIMEVFLVTPRRIDEGIRRPRLDYQV